MDSRHQVYQLLFEALLEIRDRGLESNDKTVFHLADLFHNAVLQMEQVTENGSAKSYDNLLAFIHERAKEKGCEAWVDARLEELQSKSVAG
jgi:hypothetical protein